MHIQRVPVAKGWSTSTGEERKEKERKDDRIRKKMSLTEEGKRERRGNQNNKTKRRMKPHNVAIPMYPITALGVFCRESHDLRGSTEGDCAWLSVRVN